MHKREEISDAVIKRLPRYYRCLKLLESNGSVRVSSGGLAEMLNITASQVRQDFSNFGEFGQQGYGYDVRKLKNEIGRILGLDKPHNIIVIGCGNIGTAVARYKSFKDEKFYVRAVFDAETEHIKNLPASIKILNISELEDYVSNNTVDIAAVATQKEVVLEVVAKLKALGINRIWNFTPVDLSIADPELIVESINMNDSLYVLSYKIKAY